MGHQQDAQPALGPFFALRRDRLPGGRIVGAVRSQVGPQHLRCAQRPDAAYRRLGKRCRAPLARRREGHLGHGCQGLGGQRRRDGIGGLVPAAAARHHRTQPGPQLRFFQGQGVQLLEFQPVGGQRPGFVQAQHIHAAERLHRVGLLHQRALPGDAHRAQRIRHRNCHKQPVGHQSGDDGGLLHAFRQRDGLEETVGEDQQLQIDDGEQDGSDDEVDLPLQRRQHPPVGFRSAGDLVGKARCADLLRHVVRAAADAEAPRIDQGADLFGDQVRFTGELRFVNLHLAFDNRAVQHHLIAWPCAQQVAYYQFLKCCRAFRPVPYQRSAWPGKQRNLVEDTFGAHLLDDADHDVEHDDPHRDQRVPRPAHQHQRNAKQKDRIVDEGEDVLAYDVPIGPSGGRRRVVALSGGASRRRFLVGQPTQQVLRSRCHRCCSHAWLSRRCARRHAEQIGLERDEAQPVTRDEPAAFQSGIAQNCWLATHPEPVEGWRFDKLSDRASDTFAVYPFQSSELTKIRHPVALIQQEDQERGLAGRAAPARDQGA